MPGIITGLPYNLMCDYYTIDFKRKQFGPEIYVTGKTKEEPDGFAGKVISKIDDFRNDH